MAHRSWQPQYVWETNRRGGVYWWRAWSDRNLPAQGGYLPVRTDHGAKGPLLNSLRGIAPHLDAPPAPAAGPAPRHLGMRARAERDRLARRGLLPFRPPGLPRGVSRETPRLEWRPGQTDLVVRSPAPTAGPQPWPVREVPTSHVYSRPSRGVRERKVAMRGALAKVYRVLGRAFGRITEAGDLVDALWDALPDEVKRRQAGRKGVNPLWWKMEDLWEHWERMDMAQAVANVIADQVEDALIGKTQQPLNRRSALITDSPVMGLGTRVVRGRDDVYGGVSAGVSYARDQALAAWREW